MTKRLILFIFITFFTPNLFADEAILHPVEKLCVTYELSGQIQTGSSTRCHRKYGYEQYEIQDISIGIAGFTQTQHTHNIIIGDTIYSIDLDNNTGTKTKNPMYDQISKNLQGKDSKEASQAFINAMGFQPTGESKTVAGHGCSVYNSPQLGTTCLTENGIMLEQSIMGSITIATNVQIGEEGEDKNYTLYESTTISEGPDLSNFNLQDLMKQ